MDNVQKHFIIETTLPSTYFRIVRHKSQFSELKFQLKVANVTCETIIARLEVDTAVNFWGLLGCDTV
jgi:hypothetical protein